MKGAAWKGSLEAWQAARRVAGLPYRALRSGAELAQLARSFAEKKGEKERIIFIGSPLHGNIGDHAISIAERKFFEERLPKKWIIEITGEAYRKFGSYIKSQVQESDAIVITGGGFLGSLWMEEEQMVRHIIKSFPANRIVIMPQTIYFEDSGRGRAELEISKRIYQGSPNLSIFARDRGSYALLKEEFPAVGAIEYAPDMALYLDLSKPARKREGALLCFRGDSEKIWQGQELGKLANYLGERGLQASFGTTVLDRRIGIRSREAVLSQKIEEFKRSRLVVTDRLHGMIFAAISGTPCVALDNLSGKISGVHQWVAPIGYVLFAKGIEEAYGHIDKLLAQKEAAWDNGPFVKELGRIGDRIQ